SLGVPESYLEEAADRGQDLHEYLSSRVAGRPVGAHGLIALDWMGGTRVIVEAFESAGLPVTEFIVAGGLKRNRLLMQIYADVLRRPIYVTTSDQGPALGAAIHAAGD